MTASASKRVIKNTAYLYAKTLITMFVLLWTTRIVLNSLGTIDFGIYDVVAGAIAMLGFLNAAMANTIQRFLNHAQGEGNFEKQKVIFNIGVILHGIIALIVAIFLLILMYFLFHGILNIPADRTFAAKTVYIGLVVSTFFTIMGVPYDSALNAHEDMLYYSIVGIIEAFLKLAVAFAVAHTTSDKLIIYGVLMASIPVISMTIMRIYCKKHYEECNIRPRKYFDKQVLREMISFAGWNFLGTSSGVIGNHGNSIVLNHFYGAALNAVAGIANQIQGMLSVLSAGMLKALNPIIFKSEGEGNIDRMIQYSYKGCKYSFLLLGILAFPMLAETHFFLELWLKKVPDWAVVFARLQLIRALLEQLTISLDRSLQATNHIKEINIFSLLFNLLPILVLSILYSRGFLPYWHFVVAITMMVLVPSTLRVWYCMKYCNLIIKDYVQQVLMPCLVVTTSTFIAFCMTRYALVNSSSSMALSLFVILVVFVLSSYLCMPKEEQSYVQTLTRRIKRRILK